MAGSPHPDPTTDRRRLPNRPIDELIAGTGLDVARLDNYYMRGPKVFGYMFEGFATKT